MKKHIKLISIFLSIISTIIIGGISIYIFKDYGTAVFLLSPIILGFLPGFIVGFYEPISFKTCFSLGTRALFFSCLILLVGALEGVICIAMAFPILLLFVTIGAAIAAAVHDIWGKGNPAAYGIAFLLTSALLSLGFDLKNDKLLLYSATTEIIIEAPKEKVWENVISFSEIPESDNWFFKTGIAYPLDAEIKGTGVGAIRYCNFTTGSFVEPVTVWDEPNLLAFDVKEFPVPMVEYNPFADVHPPHLEGYFRSHKGQFKLTALSENKTLLEGTTWYTVDIHPQSYWNIWSEYIVHRIHGRVLEHIKMEAEN